MLSDTTSPYTDLFVNWQGNTSLFITATDCHVSVTCTEKYDKFSLNVSVLKLQLILSITYSFENGSLMHLHNEMRG